MIRTELLAAVPTLRSPRLLLRPMGPQYFPQVWRVLADPELARLTGTHHRFTEQQVRDHLARVGTDRTRADWAIVRKEDNSFLGEVVLDELDEPNGSMNYRISLRETKICGQGYGTEAGRAVVNFGLAVLGLHRISLEVFSFNERAMASYRKLGFRPEGVLREALCWEGRRYDAHLMAVLASDLVDSPADSAVDSAVGGTATPAPDIDTAAATTEPVPGGTRS
ncbi:RimJ/RimL family protein N-acetyltransferase [Friedmanniella endophytica]|uniref:RimJ/RimL family protein N-acetyltransferase n=1 Tax=Microlunatus kandeliicorticis TaxID=1759536 RepID=A0A7W3ITQ9_9ACTN|nr:GNAT family protein [Microlunatus kandeliicorticis]MBA8795098.1 RimJ/RimL family protein N-acetyltransferase [Microlunatus kandeliicorticis]